MRVEPLGERDIGRCTCCGDESRVIWGLIHGDDTMPAAYYVHWTLGRLLEHGAHFDFILDRRADDAASTIRCAVSLAFRIDQAEPGFMLIDADRRPAAEHPTVQAALRRDVVVRTPLAAKVFALCDAVWLQDERIASLWDTSDGSGSVHDNRRT
jgi:hypothetical protein